MSDVTIPQALPHGRRAAVRGEVLSGVRRRLAAAAARRRLAALSDRLLRDVGVERRDVDPIGAEVGDEAATRLAIADLQRRRI